MRPRKRIVMYAPQEGVAATLRVVLDARGYAVLEADSMQQVLEAVRRAKGKLAAHPEAIHAVLAVGATEANRARMERDCRRVDRLRGVVTVSPRGLVYAGPNRAMTMLETMERLRAATAMHAYGAAYGKACDSGRYERAKSAAAGSMRLSRKARRRVAA